MSDLLHRVEVCKLSDAIREELREIVRQVVAEQGSAAPVGGRTVDQAAAYIGICRTNFYKQLKRYPELKASSFMIGSRRYWPKDALDAWMTEQAASQNQSVQEQGPPKDARRPAPNGRSLKVGGSDRDG